MEQFHLPNPPEAAAQGLALTALSRGTLAPGVLYAAQAGAQYRLLGLTAGEAAAAVGERSLSLSAPQALLLPPGGEGTLLAREDCMVLDASLSGAEAERLLPQGAWYARGAEELRRFLLPLFAAEENGFSVPWQQVSTAAFGLLCALFGTQGREKDDYPPVVSDAIALMHAEFAYLYGVEDVADRLEISREHLIRMFTAAVGTTPGRYLTALRIEHAKQCLRAGETSLEVVAVSSGFSGASYFGRVFRQQTGMTPLQYARRAPKGGESAPQTVYL